MPRLSALTYYSECPLLIMKVPLYFNDMRFKSQGLYFGSLSCARLLVQAILYNSHTVHVEPLLKDILDKEHNRSYLPIKDTLRGT